jgi:hypothetical protein
MFVALGVAICNGGASPPTVPPPSKGRLRSSKLGRHAASGCHGRMKVDLFCRNASTHRVPSRTRRPVTGVSSAEVSVRDPGSSPLGRSEGPGSLSEPSVCRWSRTGPARPGMQPKQRRERGAVSLARAASSEEDFGLRRGSGMRHRHGASFRRRGSGERFAKRSLPAGIPVDLAAWAGRAVAARPARTARRAIGAEIVAA